MVVTFGLEEDSDQTRSFQILPPQSKVESAQSVTYEGVYDGEKHDAGMVKASFAPEPF
jgi:hypothetical protein